MVKTKIIETTEKYDKDGKLVEKITREETSEDGAVCKSVAIDQSPSCKCKITKGERDFIRLMNDWQKELANSMKRKRVV